MSFRTVVISTLCVAGLFLIVFFVILPDQKAIEDYAQKISDFELELEKQKVLHPFYLSLMAKAGYERPAGLPMPEKETYSRSMVSELPLVLERLAQANHLGFELVIPDIKQIGDESDQLKLDVLVEGDFHAFRDFLLALGELPYLTRIEQIEVQTTHAAKECIVRLWFALAPAG